MRIFRRLFKFLFSLIFIVSICLNAILFISSDYSLVFKDNGAKRRQLANNAASQLQNAKEYTFETYDDDNSTKAIVSCVVNEESPNNLTCTQITYVYNEDGTTLRTIYFPGGDYKYVVEGNKKQKITIDKSDTSSLSVEGYAKLLHSSALVYLCRYMTYDTDYPTGSNVYNYKTKLNFNFNKLALTREVSYTYIYNSQPVVAKLTFNNNDTLVKIVSSNNEITIKYSSTDLNFPVFDSSFVEQSIEEGK